jgi:LmbE family N-acetylglucosaminyl deacetylase
VEAFLRSQRLLVVAPHADDEVIGSGGLIAKIKDLGGQVFVQVLTVGHVEHYDGDSNTGVAGDTRYREFQDAMRYLGVDGYEVVFEDGDRHLRLDQVARRDIVERIERTSKLAIDKIRPSMVVIPAPSYNQDHEAVYKAAMTACRPHLASLKPFQRVVLVADAPQLCWNMSSFKPNLYVDITKYLEMKLEAFRRHKSQQRPDPHNGGVESLRYLALARGREISVEAAEAYECLRFVV